jgi:hypothetical protein
MTEDAAAKKELDLKVTRELVSRGVFNQLHAKMLVKTAEAISQVGDSRPFAALLPYKDPQTDPDHEIASALVAEYLQIHNLQLATDCAKVELPGAVTPGKKSAYQAILDDKKTKFGLKTLVQEWETQSADILASNREALREEIQHCLNPAPPSKPAQAKPAAVASKSKAPAKRPAPAPKHTLVQKKQKEPSSDDFESDSPPPPPAPVRPTSGIRQPPSTTHLKGLDQIDHEDRDPPPQSFRIAAPKPAKKPAVIAKTPPQRAPADTFDDLDDVGAFMSDDDGPPPTRGKPVASSPAKAKPAATIHSDVADDLDGW